MARTRQPGSERGTALIEAAVLGTVLFAVLLGILEIGYIYRDYQTVSDAVSDGSRVGALMGPNPAEDGSTPDFQIVRALRDATGSMPPEWVQRIVVFKGAKPSSVAGLSPEAQVPAQCKAGTAIPGQCNVYNSPYEAFAAVETGDAGYFACPGSTVSCSWPGSSRKDGPTVSAVEYVGVWLQVRRPHLTKMFGATLTLEHASVTRIEVGRLTG